MIGIDIAVLLSVREVQSVESDPEILSRLSCNTVFTLQHPKKILFDLKRREVPILAAVWCDGDGSQAENYFESVDLNFKSGTAGWTHTKVYIMWFYVVVMGQTQKILLGSQLLALILFWKEMFSCSVFNFGTSVLEKKWIWI